MNKYILIIPLASLFLYQTAGGQHFNFQQLNVTLGLSDNNVKAVATDQAGFLWIGTSSGLNLYDGNRVTQFKKENYPALCSDDISSLLCDSRNRIWIGSDEGVTMLDEQRRFHSILLHDTLKTVSVKAIINHRVLGVILLTNKGFFSINEKNQQWLLMEFSKTIIYPVTNEPYKDVSFFSPDTLMISSDFKMFTMIDLNRQRVILRKKIPDLAGACRLNDSLVFIGYTFGKMQIWNIRTQKAEQEFTTGNLGNRSSSSINDVQTASGGSIIISSGYSGIYIFNPVTRQFQQYLHEPYNPFSPAANNTDEIYCENNGNVFVTTSEAGLILFNVKKYSAVTVPFFKDAGNRLYDNYINQIVKDNRNRFWLAAFDHLIEWDPTTNASSFYHYPYLVKGVGQRNIEIKTVCIDQHGKLWAGSRGAGLGVLDFATGKFKIYNNVYSGKDPVYRHNYIYYLMPDKEGWIWVGSRQGVYKIHTVSRQIDFLTNHPCSQLLGKRVNIIYQDRNNRIWFGTSSHGAWCWNPASNSIKNYTVAQKLPSDNCLAFLESKNGDMFIGTSKGLSIIRGDSIIRNLRSADGLRAERCLGLLEDNEGNVWISNNNSIICYDPRGQSFRYFDEKTGLSSYGFYTSAYYKNDDGTLFWGGNKGISYFQPQLLLHLNTNPNPVVYKLTIADSVQLLTRARTLKLPYRKNNITFHFAAVNIMGSRNIFYQYMLKGADKVWTRSIDQYEVRYNSLAPGKYAFLLKASADGINWIDSQYAVNITILNPFWKTYWFMAATVLLLGGFLYWLQRRRIKLIRHEAELKHKIAESEMMALRAQMNPHFIFNSLNAIDNLIQTNQKDKATTYLARFARLIRSVLDSSKNNVVSFQKDFESLQLYLQMEQFRCNNKFEYELKADEELLQSDYKVPALIVQPFVENAIHHGLLNKQTGERKLIVSATLENDYIKYTVCDNGVGRAKAEQLKEINKPGHQSYGINITKERIHLYNQNGANNDVIITDLFENTEPAGTKVEIKLKMSDPH